MVDFKEYENAVAAFRETQNFVVNPLVSSPFHFKNLSNYLIFNDDFKSLMKLSKSEKWHNIDELPFNSHEETILVTTPELKIMFASNNLLQMNGYRPEEVLGHSPKLFQGSGTNPETSHEIGEAIRNLQPFEKMILNYRKDGSTYKCHIKGFPLVDKKGNLKHFIAIEKAA